MSGSVWRKVRLAGVLLCLTCAESLLRLVVRLAWSGLLDPHRARDGLRIARAVRRRAVRLALRVQARDIEGRNEDHGH